MYVKIAHGVRDHCDQAISAGISYIVINNVSCAFQFINAVLIPMGKNGAVDEVHLHVLFSDGRGIYSLFIFRVLEPQK